MGTIIRRTLVLITVVGAILAGSSASAQYFGRNKVQYKQLEFQVLRTEHFDIYFYPQERAGVDISARLAERWYARLARLLGHELSSSQPLVLYASHADFAQTNVIPGELGEGTGGVTEPLRRRIVLPLGGPLADTDHVLGHELVHAFQFDITRRPDGPVGQSGIERLPLWFIEGMAEYLSMGPVDPNTAMWLRDAVRQNRVPSIDDLDDSKYFPYRWGQAFWAYVGGRFGDAVIRDMLEAATSAGTVDAAIEHVSEKKTEEFSKEWQAAIRATYEPVLASAAPATDTGQLVISGTDFGNSINVGPALSPDGRWLAFLSSRSFFSIDLYIADATTGHIERRLTSTASSPHVSSLQFIYSAGAWDRESRRLAVATVVSGRPTLMIFDAASGRVEREVPLSTVDEIFNPTWAPDGHAICFTGMSQGLTDLFVYDLNDSHLLRLTNDAFADLQPAWSPDGLRIAFATDRFSTDLGTLAVGSYQLALIDPSGGPVEAVPAFADGQSLNPQWSPDGLALYFIADPNGVANLYRQTLSTSDVRRLTNVATGVSGITRSSPAISIAAARDVAAFSVYNRGNYDIYRLDVSGPGAAPALATAHAAVLPPRERRPSVVGALLASPNTGLPEPVTKPAKPYSPALSLEAVGQPVITVGASRFGAAFGGGVSFLFGDMLGTRMLATAVQFSSGFAGSISMKDLAAQVAYLSQAHRWNWGVVGGQVPYISGGFQTGVGVTSRGELVQVDQTIILRQTERSATGFVAYPFDRTRRIELSGGLTQITFDQIVHTSAYSLATGDLVVSDTSETSLAPSLTLATPAAAFVSDTANFGATSPIQGRRYRVEVAPTFGSVSFTSMLGDYRRYFMPVRFYTVALRAIHYGRYGGGAEDSRLNPLYLGYPTLVRGYDVNSFDSRECIATAASSCPVLDRLMGSRLLVGNLELRVPLLRPFGASQRMYGPLPIEMAIFADGGVAWDSHTRPALIGGTREGVSSVGVTMRVNLAGIAVGQFDVVRPLQRPGAGWIFQFNLTPGF